MKTKRRAVLTTMAAFFIPLAIYLLLWAFLDRTVSRCSFDLNSDGTEEKIELKGRGQYAQTLVISACGMELYKAGLETLKPWKVQTADVDGDGNREISLGVYKTTRTDSVMRKRPFIYTWDEKGLHPKWLGSRLSKPFDDYVFSDLDFDAADELAATEYLADGLMVIDAYKWNGFGFESICESEGYQSIKNLKASDSKKTLEADIKVGGKWRHMRILYDNGKWIPDE